jgi:phosphate-selective porin OprO/OprP
MRRIQSSTLALLATAPFVLATAPDARAAEGTPPPTNAPTLEERLQALDQEIRILKRKQELAAEAAGSKGGSQDGPRFTANAKDGFSLSSADGDYRLRIGGFAQIEGRYFQNDDKLPFPNTFTIGKVRPIIEGTLARYFDYRIMLDLVATPSLVDAFVTANIDPAFKITAGRYKVPFGLENLQSDTNTAFITRGLPTALVPVRDAGFQVSGDLLGNTVGYAIGVFNGPIDGGNRDPDTNDDKDVIGRLWLTPFRTTDLPALNQLSVGIAGAIGQEEGTYNAAGTAVTSTNLAGYRTPGNNVFFNYSGSTIATTSTPANTVVAKGERTRFSPQGYYAWGPFDVLAEYVSSSQRVQIGANSALIHNTAWQVESGFVLTGESASLKGVVPASTVGTGWGAWQIVARYGQIEIDDEAFSGGYASRTASARSATDIGVGLNWFLNRNIKVQLNYDHVGFSGGGGGTAGDPADRETEQVIQSRIQFVF